MLANWWRLGAAITVPGPWTSNSPALTGPLSLVIHHNSYVFPVGVGGNPDTCTSAVRLAVLTATRPGTAGSWLQWFESYETQIGSQQDVLHSHAILQDPLERTDLLP